MEGEIVRMKECGKETAPFFSMQGKRKQEGTYFHPTPLLLASIKNSPLDKSEYREVEGEERGPKEQGSMLDTGVHQETPGHWEDQGPMTYWLCCSLIRHLLSIYCGVRYCHKFLGTGRSIAPSIRNRREGWPCTRKWNSHLGGRLNSKCMIQLLEGFKQLYLSRYFPFKHLLKITGNPLPGRTTDLILWTGEKKQTKQTKNP